MTNDSLAAWVRAIAYAAAATALLLAILVVAAEEIAPLKDWLKYAFHHHWLGKGAVSILVFAVLALALRYRRDEISLSTVIVIETIAVFLAALVIASFFLLHTLKVV